MKKTPLEKLMSGLTRKQQLMFAACVIVQEDGRIRNANTRLMRLLGMSPETVSRSIAGLVKVNMVKRSGRTLFVRDVHRLSDLQCPGCEKPHGSASYCTKCRQTVGHKDRKWYGEAIDLAVAGKSPYHISQVLNQPLWRAEVGFSKDQAGSVVELLMRNSICPPDYVKAYKRQRSRFLNGGMDE